MKSDKRLPGLDAARGLAMFGVCLSHFGVGIQHRDPVVAGLLITVGMFASPAFMLVSGALLGYLVATAGDRVGLLQRQLIDRGLFLVLIAHFVIAVTFYPYVHAWSRAAVLSFMTDTIGVSLILGAPLVRATGKRWRLLFAAGLYGGSRLVELAWTPSNPALGRIWDALVGSTDPAAITRQDFAILPWFAVYLAATVLGEVLVVRVRQRSVGTLGRQMILAGLATFMAAFVIKVSYWILRPTSWSDFASQPRWGREVWELTSPFSKFPPGPTYLLACGGVALVLTGWTLMASERGWLPRLLSKFSVVGRASLMVFLVQFFVYNLLVPLLPVPNRLVLLPYFAATLVGLWLVARFWGRIDGNRYLTVGLRARMAPSPQYPEVRKAS